MSIGLFKFNLIRIHHNGTKRRPDLRIVGVDPLLGSGIEGTVCIGSDDDPVAAMQSALHSLVDTCLRGDAGNDARRSCSLRY